MVENKKIKTEYKIKYKTKKDSLLEDKIKKLEKDLKEAEQKNKNILNVFASYPPIEKVTFLFDFLHILIFSIITLNFLSLNSANNLNKPRKFLL